MGPIDCVDLSRLELYEQVQGDVWRGWAEAEPALCALDGLEALWHRRGRDADMLLGALIRLAARDGADDRLAAIAVAHQLATASRRLALSLRDLSDDIDELVAGALWMEIKSFPWRARTHGYATSLIWATRTSVLDLLMPTRVRGGGEREEAMDPLAPASPWTRHPDPEDERANGAERSHREFVELIEWAASSGVVSHEDVCLLHELVAAGERLTHLDSPHTRQGVCSQAAVALVARRRGVCGRTVARHRNRVIATLRDAVPTYLRQVA